ncbi:MAG: serine/threonine protein kinase [Sphingomonadales bacterium]|nr:MAG: serine/threonine protein kinase [Sphingomonadales bacterium]
MSRQSRHRKKTSPHGDPILRDLALVPVEGRNAGQDNRIGGIAVTSASGSLSAGQRLVTANGRHGAVGQLLGAGGQGEVYHVTVEGLPLALKWYHRHYVAIDHGLRARLQRAVQRGAPNGSFLWPIDMVEIPGSGSFGYLMPLRGGQYRSIRDLIAPPPARLELSLAQRAHVCLQLAESFLELHASGFCYQDINFGNIFLDPATAAILICDNDNVNIDGADASIYGTRKFMAPEVVRRETLPNSRTDLFSMSVLFFYTLFGWHPLDGRREHEVRLMDAASELRLYGTDPLFLFDQLDGGNGPVEGFHDPIVAQWNALPARLRMLFVRTFGEGLRDTAARVLETEWRGPLAAVADAAFACGECGFEHVADASCTAADRCAECDATMAWPDALRIGARLILLDDRRDVSIDMRRIAARQPDGRVEAHPSSPGILGLRNLTATAWTVTLPDGNSLEAGPGRAVRIVRGARIRFGKIIGEIVGPCDLEQAA